MNGHKYPREFERVSKDGLERLMVPGGWIVLHSSRYIVKDNHVACSEAAFFYPDPDHQWVLEGE